MSCSVEFSMYFFTTLGLLWSENPILQQNFVRLIWILWAILERGNPTLYQNLIRLVWIFWVKLHLITEFHKIDLEILGHSREGQPHLITEFHKTDVDILGHSREGKPHFIAK